MDQQYEKTWNDAMRGLIVGLHAVDWIRTVGADPSSRKPSVLQGIPSPLREVFNAHADGPLGREALDFFNRIPQSWDHPTLADESPEIRNNPRFQSAPARVKAHEAYRRHIDTWDEWERGALPVGLRKGAWQLDDLEHAEVETIKGYFRERVAHLENSLRERRTEEAKRLHGPWQYLRNEFDILAREDKTLYRDGFLEERQGDGSVSPLVRKSAHENTTLVASWDRKESEAAPGGIEESAKEWVCRRKGGNDGRFKGLAETAGRKLIKLRGLEGPSPLAAWAEAVWSEVRDKRWDGEPLVGWSADGTFSQHQGEIRDPSFSSARLCERLADEQPPAASSPPPAAPAAQEPKPARFLRGWADILKALDLSNDRSNQDAVRRANDAEGGPIERGGPGVLPAVSEGLLRKWWDTRHRS